MSLWDMDVLREQLRTLKKGGRVAQWSIQTEKMEREERYFLLSGSSEIALDQERSVSDQQTFVRVEVEKGERYGSARKQIFGALNLKEQLEALIATAQLGDEEKWAYNRQPNNPEENQNRADPLIWENVALAAGRLEKSLRDGVARQKEIFNSAEIFVSKRQVQLEISNGFSGQNFVTKVYAEVCFSAKDEASGKAEEFMVKRSGARLDQIDFIAMCSESADYARHSLHTEKPEAGKYSVIIHGAEICPLMTDLSDQLNSSSRYLGMPFIEPGADLIPEFRGDAFKVLIDPEMNHAFFSAHFDEFGDPQRRLVLAENNRVQASITDRRMANYLKINPTTSRGVIVVEPGKVCPESELRRSQDRVLEILQFSGLFSDSQDLSFASEIRLARLYDNRSGKVTYIKGGSLSGNFRECFATAKWSDKRQLENLDEMSGPQSYYGPAQVLISNVNISS